VILYTPDGTLKLYESSAVTNEFAVYPPSFTMDDPQLFVCYD
jgi:hypothetical protein